MVASHTHTHTHSRGRCPRSCSSNLEAAVYSPSHRPENRFNRSASAAPRRLQPRVPGEQGPGLGGAEPLRVPTAARLHAGPVPARHTRRSHASPAVAALAPAATPTWLRAQSGYLEPRGRTPQPSLERLSMRVFKYSSRTYWRRDEINFKGP